LSFLFNFQIFKEYFLCTNDTGNCLYNGIMKHKRIIETNLEDLNLLVPGQSVDCVIIGFEHHTLKILVLKWKSEEELWALPGGFVLKNEDLDKAAIRVLRERTGIELPFLEQFRSFGKCHRRKDDTLKKLLDVTGINEKQAEWFKQRFITTGYVSLVDIQKCELKTDFTSELIQWTSFDEMPELIFDHNEIVTSAIRFIKNQINYLPVGINLLPKKFTMKELQKLYESILGRELDRGNFQRKMLKLDIFIRHEKHLLGGAHKAPYLYSFDEVKYQNMLDQGFGFNS